MVSPQTRRAFTLIELLTVIAIIALLMGLLFPVLNIVRENARKTHAKNDIEQTIGAVKAYFADYGRYPIVTAITGDAEYGNGVRPNSDVFNPLRAIPLTTNANDALNPRKVVY